MRLGLETMLYVNAKLKLRAGDVADLGHLATFFGFRGFGSDEHRTIAGRISVLSLYREQSLFWTQTRTGVGN